MGYLLFIVSRHFIYLEYGCCGHLFTYIASYCFVHTEARFYIGVLNALMRYSVSHFNLFGSALAFFPDAFVGVSALLARFKYSAGNQISQVGFVA
jgi:hypothetical protein